MLVCEEFARSSETALNLVEDQRDLSFAGQRTKFANEPDIQQAYATLSLHWLHDERCCRFGVERERDVFDVTLDDRDSRCKRSERRAIRRPVRRGQRSEQPTMKRPAKRHDLVFRRTDRARPAASELECAFVRLRPGVAEEDLVGKRTLGERVRELLSRERRVQIRDVNE